MVIYRLQCSACGKSIERDLCRMYLQRKTYTQFLKLIQDGRKATGEIIIPLFVSSRPLPEGKNTNNAK